MDQELEKIIIECAKNVKKRKELFLKIGQEFLKPLKDRELEEKTFEVFQLILQHQKDWKGQVLIPEYYRLDKQKSVFKDIWYTLRDYFAWCVLYNSEVDSYFKHDKNGTIQVLENPKLRIMDKDNFKQVTKIENGKKILLNIKKEKTFVIDSGFTLAQKSRILNVTVVGLIEVAQEHKKKSSKASIKTIEDTTMPDDEIPGDTSDQDGIKDKSKKAKFSKKIKKIDNKEENQANNLDDKIEDIKEHNEETKPKTTKRVSVKKATQVEGEENTQLKSTEKHDTKKKTLKSKKKE